MNLTLPNTAMRLLALGLLVLSACETGSSSTTAPDKDALAPETAVSADATSEVLGSDAPVCTPECAGRECGDDGCGGDCGLCPDIAPYCMDGLCAMECAPSCAGKACGDDGCGGDCGTCPEGQPCEDNLCQCTPSCDGKACGDDGCGGSCGDCPAEAPFCDQGTCSDACFPVCEGKECGDDGCGGNCGGCPDVAPYCVNFACAISCTPNCEETSCGDDGCGGSCGECPEGEGCISGACHCLPDCEGKECGSDGCGGICGSCKPSAPHCNEGTCSVTCVPDCTDKECGDDGCGGDCGGCPEIAPYCADNLCSIECTPNCEGKQCGDDGCDGTCGQCGLNEACEEFACACLPDCTDKACGDNGCGGSCGECEEDTPFCVDHQCTVACVPDCDGKECGEDGCGGDCGACPEIAPVCLDGLCALEACVPDCAGKQCGEDGCEGECGPCGPAETCDPSDQCVCAPSCQDKVCGEDGCGGECGTCVLNESCQSGSCVNDDLPTPGSCQGACGDSSPDGSCYCDSGCTSLGDCCTDFCDKCSALNPDACGGCVSSCDGQSCGDDGCGGSCGTCGADFTCVAGNCQGQSSGSSCDEPLVLVLGETIQQDTTGAPDEFFFAEGSCPNLTTPNEPGGSEQVFKFIAPSSGNYTFGLDVIDSVWLNLFVVENCSNAEDTALACFADSTIFSEEVNVWIDAGESVAVIVDSDTWASTDSGAYTLKVTQYSPCNWSDCDGKTCGDDGCGYGAVCGQCSGTDACNSASQCVQTASGDSCESPLIIAGDLPLTLAGSTQDPGTTNYFSYAEEMCPGNLAETEGNAAVDQVWAFTPEKSGNFTFEIDTWESFSGIISYLMGSCDSEAVSCLSALPYYDSVPLTAYLLKNMTYNFVVDGYDGSLTSDGEYQFTVDEYQECFSADCAGKVCGDNGCNEGALCGVCPDGEVCGAGTCYGASEGDTCADAFYVSVSVTEPHLSNHDSSYASNDYMKAYGECSDFSAGTGSEGEDQAFQLTFEDPGTYRITVTPLDSWYAAIYVVDGSCLGLESDCVASDDFGSQWTGATVDVEVSAFESLYVIVDGDTDNDWIIENGPYTFEVEALP